MKCCCNVCRWCSASTKLFNLRHYMETTTEELNLEYSSSFLSGKQPEIANKEETKLIIGNCVTCWVILSTVKEDEVFGEGRPVGQTACPPFRSNLTVRSLSIISASFRSDATRSSTTKFPALNLRPRFASGQGNSFNPHFPLQATVWTIHLESDLYRCELPSLIIKADFSFRALRRYSNQATGNEEKTIKYIMSSTICEFLLIFGVIKYTAKFCNLYTSTNILSNSHRRCGRYICYPWRKKLLIKRFKTLREESTWDIEPWMKEQYKNTSLRNRFWRCELIWDRVKRRFCEPLSSLNECNVFTRQITRKCSWKKHNRGVKIETRI